MRGNFVEFITGMIVVLISVFLLGYGYMGTRGNRAQGYELVVKFDRADGLVEGGDIKVGGIRVGTVAKLVLDPKSYEALVHMKIDPQVHLPTDSSASIVSENLLGGKYIAIVPGGDETMLNPGDTFQFSQSSMILESLIGKLIFDDKDKNKDDKKESHGK